MTPEAIMCGGCGETNSEKRCIGCMHDFGTPESAWVQKYAIASTAALSQTLPAPGEVDFRALLIEAGRNAGAYLDDRVSDDFLKVIPEEVRLRIASLATVAAANDEGSWKPIATAPLDGRVLIGWFENDEWQSRVAWWDAKFALDWDEDADESVDVGAWTDGAIADFGMEQVHNYEPTHWKPKPAGPAAIRLLSQGGGK